VADSLTPKVAEEFAEVIRRAKTEIHKVIVGQEDLIDLTLQCIFCQSHALLMGVPGLAKTLLVTTISQVVGVTFRRIQFTPDLMPSDITGTEVLQEDPQTGAKTFAFVQGPVFANLILADEINRAPPKSQAALLESMQERQVSIGNKKYRLPVPFFVLATQNPIEMEGTYPLPEAQLDRFLFKLLVGYPSLEQLDAIVERTTGAALPSVSPVLDGPRILELRALVREVPIAPHVREYALSLVLATHPDSPVCPEQTNRFVRYGASPRGAQALILAGKVWALLDGRWSVSFEDIQRAAPPALRHRILLNFEGQAEGIAPDDVISAVIARLSEKTKPALEL